MDREIVKLAVRTTLALLARLALRTRTPSDDLMSAMLKSNEERIVDAVLELANDPAQPPTEAQITQALQHVGIKV